MKNFIRLLSALIYFSIILQACSGVKDNTEAHNIPIYTHVDWSKNANIYEVNVRQYTPEGTLKAFEAHLPRLQQMGVKILWLMPIHPISEINRKGTLGSYYAVQDYQKVNPDLGTLDDLKQLVDSAHALGMKVIIDWVANNTGWDNWLITEHPNWYTTDSLGNITIPANTDWTDVADLNYDVPEMREYMIQSLEYWIDEADIDGYRCDVAGFVPTDFWVDARQRLDAIKPVFMLAEDESPEIHQAFDMSYGWEMHHIMNKIAQGKETVKSIDAYLAKVDSIYNADDYIMNFTSNHDENSWNGTEYERMGNAYKAMAVLSATLPGMPLIYSGQEEALNKRLAFFDKDTIVWNNYDLASFYQTLMNLKTDHKSLWNGKFGGNFSRVTTSVDSCIFSFERTHEQEKVMVLLNLSEQKQTFSLKNGFVEGKYVSLFNQTNIVICNDSSLTLEPWGFLILVGD